MKLSYKLRMSRTSYTRNLIGMHICARALTSKDPACVKQSEEWSSHEVCLARVYLTCNCRLNMCVCTDKQIYVSMREHPVITHQIACYTTRLHAHTYWLTKSYAANSAVTRMCWFAAGDLSQKVHGLGPHTQPTLTVTISIQHSLTTRAVSISSSIPAIALSRMKTVDGQHLTC